MGGKNLLKHVLIKLVLVKTGNGEKKFLQSNTIISVMLNLFQHRLEFIIN